jgi:hypothetical protein
VPRTERAHINGNGSAGWFEKFWQEYPSRRQHSNPQKPAREKFEALIKRGIEPEMLIAAAERYRRTTERDGTDPRYIAQAVTWLRQERFADEVRLPEPQPLRAGMI